LRYLSGFKVAPGRGVEVGGLLTMSGKRIFKSGILSRVVDLLAEWLGPATSGVEQIMTATGAASTFVSIGAHGLSGDWWR